MELILDHNENTYVEAYSPQIADFDKESASAMRRTPKYCFATPVLRLLTFGDTALKSWFLLAFGAHKKGCDNDIIRAVFPSIWVSFKVPEGHNPRGTTLREALRGNLPLRGLCGGFSEGSAGSLQGFCGVSAGFCGGPRVFPRVFGGSDPMLVTLGNCWSILRSPNTAKQGKRNMTNRPCFASPIEGVWVVLSYLFCNAF